MFALYCQPTALKSIRLGSRFKSTFTHHHFVPVINIPESELAHNAFFSLHRPLLGLSGEQDFFAAKKTPEEALFEELTEYMMQLEAFVPPVKKE